MVHGEDRDLASCGVVIGSGTPWLETGSEFSWRWNMMSDTVWRGTRSVIP